MADKLSSPDERGGLALIIYALLWCLTVLPPLGIYALGNGMFGRSVLLVPVDVAKDVMKLEPMAIAIVVLSLPILAIPLWLIRRFVRTR